MCDPVNILQRPQPFRLSHSFSLLPKYCQNHSQAPRVHLSCSLAPLLYEYHEYVSLSLATFRCVAKVRYMGQGLLPWEQYLCDIHKTFYLSPLLSIWHWCTGLGWKVVPRLRESFRQAEVISNINSKIYQTWIPLFTPPLYAVENLRNLQSIQLYLK